MDRFTGGCLCGNVRFVAWGLPYRVGICHCMDCRKHHGALFQASAIFPQNAVTVEGEPALERARARNRAELDACVEGVPDARLGAVPFAAVELRRDAAAPTEAELKDLVREELPSHHVPVAVAVVDALPRNAALKVRPGDVAALYRT